MKRGVTLLELVVALALSVLLVTTTAGVLKSMSQKKKVFADRIEVQPWRDELALRLRDDLLRSKEMRIGSKTLELSGFCGHDPETGEPIQSPVLVVWQLKQEDGYRLLIRTESAQGGIEEWNMSPHRELMAIGISNISIGTFQGLEQEEKSEMQTLHAGNRRTDEVGDWTSMPKALKLIVHGPKQEILVDELVFR